MGRGIARFIGGVLFWKPPNLENCGQEFCPQGHRLAASELMRCYSRSQVTLIFQVPLRWACAAIPGPWGQIQDLQFQV